MTIRGPVQNGVRSRVIRQSSRSARATTTRRTSCRLPRPVRGRKSYAYNCFETLAASRPGHAYLRSPNVLTKIPTLSASNSKFPQTAEPANPVARPDPPPTEPPHPGAQSEQTSKLLKRRWHMVVRGFGESTTSRLPSRLAVYYNTPVARHGKKPQIPRHLSERTRTAQLAE